MGSIGTIRNMLPNKIRRYDKLRSSDPKPIGIASLLQYIDMEYMSNQEYDSICDLDINDEAQQLQVIRLAIIPGYLGCNEITQKSLKKLLELCLKEGVALDELFEMRSFPFENEIEDKKGFLQNLYKELFEKEHGSD